MSSPEVQSESEKSPEIKVSNEHYEALDKKLEAGAELSSENLESNEKRESKARAEALENAVSAEKGAEKETSQSKGRSARKRGTISKKEKTASYKRRIKDVQAELPPAERAFSKVLHNPAVERTSEFVGATIARPNAILAGAVAAFILVLAVYLIAKTLGYVLSGFETIGAFIVGWVLGILYDYFRVLITGKKS
jgi:hypothetical protein